MCVIVMPKGKKKVTDEMIDKMWKSNGDGAGLAYIKKGKVVVQKGFMTKDEFKARYASLNTFPHALHFRIGTHGGNVPMLTHPFPCDGSGNALRYKADSVLFHNGIVSDHLNLLFSLAGAIGKERIKKLIAEDEFSDTVVGALAVEAFGRGALKKLSGKWLFFTAKEQWLYGDWDEDDDYYYSNKSWNFSWKGYVRTYKVDNNGVVQPEFGDTTFNIEDEDQSASGYKTVPQ